MKKLNPTQQSFVDTLVTLGGEATTEQVAEATGKVKETVGKRLGEMVADGVLARGSRKNDSTGKQEITYKVKANLAEPDDIEGVVPSTKVPKVKEPAPATKTPAKGKTAPKVEKSAAESKKPAEKAKKPTPEPKPKAEPKVKVAKVKKAKEPTSLEVLAELKMTAMKKGKAGTAEAIEVATRYKGKVIKGMFLDGKIMLGKKEYTPFQAWRHITNKSANGWFQFYFVNPAGELTVLNELNPKMEEAK